MTDSHVLIVWLLMPVAALARYPVRGHRPIGSTLTTAAAYMLTDDRAPFGSALGPIITAGVLRGSQ